MSSNKTYLTGPSTWIRHELEDKQRGTVTWWACDPCNCLDKPDDPTNPHRANPHRASRWSYSTIHPECLAGHCLHFVHHVSDYR